MSSSQLARLTALSEKRTERRLRDLNDTRQEISRLQQQHDELIAFADSYQTAGADSATTLPSMLRVRRTFVVGVLDEVEKLEARIDEHRRVLVQQQAKHRRCASEALALDSLRRQARESELATVEHRERQALDEVGGRVWPSMDSQG